MSRSGVHRKLWLCIGVGWCGLYARAVVGTEKWRLVARRVVLGVACVVTLLCLSLLVAAVLNDRAIDSHRGTANAQVDSVSFSRTIIRYVTPDGVTHSPPNGVLYPSGLAAGDLVRIEYDTEDPELARVAGRSAKLTLLPLGTTIAVTWLIAGPLFWWLKRRSAQPVKRQQHQVGTR